MKITIEFDKHGMDSVTYDSAELPDLPQVNDAVTIPGATSLPQLVTHRTWIIGKDEIVLSLSF